MLHISIAEFLILAEQFALSGFGLSALPPKPNTFLHTKTLHPIPRRSNQPIHRRLYTLQPYTYYPQLQIIPSNYIELHIL